MDQTISRILVAGVGNELKRDDAFGVAFVKDWDIAAPNCFLKAMEVGIGGIHLVQELHSGYDILVLVDAVDWQGAPGDIFFREVSSVSDLKEMDVFERRNFLADMHYTNPDRALMLAKGLGVLPCKVFILGCQAGIHDEFAIGLTSEVKAAIPKARKILEQWLNNNIPSQSKNICHENN